MLFVNWCGAKKLCLKLQVYSWEPVICHDAVDMGWSTLGDLCIHDGKLLGCSFYRNSVGVWVGDISVAFSTHEPFLCLYEFSFYLIFQTFKSPLTIVLIFSFLFQCIEPYGDGFVPKESECTDQKFNIPGCNSSDKVGSDVRSTLGFRSPSPDYETKEIKNIYVDCKLIILFFYQ